LPHFVTIELVWPLDVVAGCRLMRKDLSHVTEESHPISVGDRLRTLLRFDARARKYLIGRGSAHQVRIVLFDRHGIIPTAARWGPMAEWLCHRSTRRLALARF
jgi:hypothetical protein